MPIIGVVLAVLEVAVITIVDEPSRLPMVLPVTSPTLNRPIKLEPSAMAVKHELAVFVLLRAEVWLIPEMMFPCTLVGVVVLTLAKSRPRNSFVDPLMVVVPGAVGRAKTDHVTGNSERAHAELMVMPE